MFINGKKFADWIISDIELLIDNPDFSESENIDYKRIFTQLEVEDKINKNKANNEFRLDICSFANNNGGTIFYGICESSGVASKIMGVEILNLERFEQDRRNELSTILPHPPSLHFNFIKTHDENTYIVALNIGTSFLKPYINRERDGTYNLFKRNGASKTSMNYTEIQNMFNNNMVLTQQINSFRDERIDYYSDLIINDPPFFMIQCIPENYLDTHANIDIFAESGDGVKTSFFSDHYSGYTTPNVDGIVYNDAIYQINGNYKSFQFYNNKAIEYFEELPIRVHEQKKYVSAYNILSAFSRILFNTFNYFEQFDDFNEFYVLISIINGKGYQSQQDDFYRDRKFVIDRNHIAIPIVKFNKNWKDNTLPLVEHLIKSIYYACGIDECNVNKFTHIFTKN